MYCGNVAAYRRNEMADELMHHNHCHNYGYNRGYGSGEHLTLAGEIAAGHSNLTNQVHLASVNGIRETSQSARDTVNAVRDSILASNQIGNINLQATERNGGETRQEVERAAADVRDRVGEFANQAGRDHANVIQNLCDVRKEMSTGFGSTQLEMAKQHAAIQLEMCKQHADLAAKMAECCCELKQEHSTTRALISSQALDECRRRESDLQNEVNLLKITASLPGPSGK
jgi:hypothetical protein